jgi:hypothetical protein
MADTQLENSVRYKWNDSTAVKHLNHVCSGELPV